MIENLKELVNDKQMINGENKPVELKIGKITINADVIEGNNLEKIFVGNEIVR